MQVTAFDVYPTQLAHLADKRAAVASGNLSALNVEDAPVEQAAARGGFALAPCPRGEREGRGVKA